MCELLKVLAQLKFGYPKHHIKRPGMILYSSGGSWFCLSSQGVQKRIELLGTSLPSGMLDTASQAFSENLSDTALLGKGLLRRSLGLNAHILFGMNQFWGRVWEYPGRIKVIGWRLRSLRCLISLKRCSLDHLVEGHLVTCSKHRIRESTKSTPTGFLRSLGFEQALPPWFFARFFCGTVHVPHNLSPFYSKMGDRGR